MLKPKQKDFEQLVMLPQRYAQQRPILVAITPGVEPPKVWFGMVAVTLTLSPPLNKVHQTYAEPKTKMIWSNWSCCYKDMLDNGLFWPKMGL